MLLKGCCTIWTLLWGIAAAAVFVEKHEANSVLRRWRRANSGFLEELKQGNLERECIEEVCSYEEAREVFEDEDQTMLFWLSYDGVHRVLGTLHKSRDPCLINPCYNNGTCINLGNSYKCQCLDGFEGRYCQTVFEDTLKCLYLNGRCEQFCDGSGSRRRCYCADGYVLGDDGRRCVPSVEYPCGRVAPPEIGRNQTPVISPRMVGTYHCPRGNCPWQVLVQLNAKSHCGGVLIHPRWVITAAHCIHGHDPQNLTVVAGEYNLDVDEGTEQEIAVSLAIANDGYVPATGDSDVALLQLSRAVNLSQHVIPICLPTKDFATRELLLLRYHTVSGWGKRTTGGNVKTLGAPVSPVLRMMSVPILQNSICSLRARFNLTENMLCAGYLEGRQESCRGDDGSPLVSLFGSTHFLTGVVGWGRGCGAGYFAVYTNMANFVEWVEKTMKNPPSSPPQS